MVGEREKVDAIYFVQKSMENGEERYDKMVDENEKNGMLV